jgi:chromosome segregation ATPase
LEQKLHELSAAVTNDRAALDAAVTHLGNLEAASAARLDELRKLQHGNTDILSRRMNRHRQELDASREEIVQLHRELEDLKADKVILEARVDSMAERLCKCSEGSPRVRGSGSAAEPIELEEDDLEYVTPPLTSSPAEEEVPKLVPGRPTLNQRVNFDS